MIEVYKYKIEFTATKDVYEKLKKAIEEISPNSYYRIEVEKSLEDVTFRTISGEQL